MTQFHNNFLYSYDDEFIAYKSMFPAFGKKEFNELDQTYSQLDIDTAVSYTHLTLPTIA